MSVASNIELREGIIPVRRLVINGGGDDEKRALREYDDEKTLAGFVSSLPRRKGRYQCANNFRNYDKGVTRHTSSVMGPGETAERGDVFATVDEYGTRYSHIDETHKVTVVVCVFVLARSGSCLTVPATKNCWTRVESSGRGPYHLWTWQAIEMLRRTLLQMKTDCVVLRGMTRFGCGKRFMVANAGPVF